MKVKNKKDGQIYSVFIPEAAYTSDKDGAEPPKKMVVYFSKNEEHKMLVTEFNEFWEMFEKLPLPAYRFNKNRCCVCGSMENLRVDPALNWRCEKPECNTF